MANEPHYTTREICEATGLAYGLIRGRIKLLGLKSDCGYTYEEVKKIVGYRRKSRPPDRRNIAKLKLALMNDGYSVRKD